jgi:hypothetical protein
LKPCHLLLLLSVGCARAPRVEEPRPDSKATSGNLNPCAPFGPAPKTVFGRDTSEPEAPPTQPALTGAALTDVHIEHTTLGQGGKTNGTATFVAPAAGPGRLRLEAHAGVPGYGWKLRIDDPSRHEAPFSLACERDRRRQTVPWTFALLDEQGRRSNQILVNVECTGEAIPGTGPRLAAVELTSSDLALGARTAGVATIEGTESPFLLIGKVTSRGNGWTASYSKVWHDRSFSMGCSGGSPHVIDVSFQAEDTFGRRSNTIEKRIICGDCRPGGG